MIFLNQDDPGLTKEYNTAKDHIQTFKRDAQLVDDGIFNYKSVRNIPLSFDDDFRSKLFSLNEDLS